MSRRGPFRVAIVGVSTGGVKALQRLLGPLPADFPLPLLVVQHISADAGDGLARLLDQQCQLTVLEADSGAQMRAGCVHLAPANYHLMVESGGRLALSTDAPVSYARPSVDVLFESAADAFGAAVIGVILTGANHDGSRGLKAVKQAGGIAIVQDPEEAEARDMPRAAIAATRVDHVLPLDEISALLAQLAGLAVDRRGRHAGR